MTGKNYKIEDPKGVDFAIQRLQNLLFSSLDWQNVEMFGRVDKVPNPENQQGFKPYAFYLENDYKAVTRNDNYSANIFFVTGDRSTTREGIVYSIETKIVFMVNLKKLYPLYKGRADALAQKNANEILKTQTAFVLSSMGTGIKECLGEFDAEDLKFTNMHPNHVFCLTGQLSYQLSC